jgi:ApbE superfamily uncharacterized protein (UPF0280 family)
MSAVAALLADGRLHLQHGPIDCLCRAWGKPAEVDAAYAQAAAAFADILAELCVELPQLRRPLPSLPPHGDIARAMHAACMPCAGGFITPMAAVAGSVADHVLATLLAGRQLDRCFVNNGGDIAFHLAPGTELVCGLIGDLANPTLDGHIRLRAEAKARGLATSGRACKGHGGRSFSRGIADTVTVLASNAARADAAATVIANQVDLPGHPAIIRRSARSIDPDSDLGDIPITWELAALQPWEVDGALDAGLVAANGLLAAGLIEGAVLALRRRVAVCGADTLMLEAA